MAWYVAESLERLLSEINASAPKRDKSADGSIGDASHSSRDSDHNPCDCHNAVCARDFTHDPKGGFDSYEFAKWLAARCKAGDEKRVKYIISNGKIASETYGFVWQNYSGSNPHDHHVHVSVDHPQSTFDNDKTWNWPPSGGGNGDDDMPEYVSLSGDGFTLRAAGDEWTPVRLQRESADAGNVHGETAWLNLGGAKFSGQVRVNVASRSDADTSLLVRWAEYRKDGDQGFVSAPMPSEYPLTTGGTGVHDEVLDSVGKNNRVRAEVKARGGDIEVSSVGLTALYWR